ISIAWAATEYLHNEVRAKTLFATHYHELTRLADHLDDVANVHVAVDGEPPSSGGTSSRPGDDRGGDVTFLRTVRDGPTDRSYGIHVADLAGVPDPVVDRASAVLESLRADNAIEARGSGGGEPVQAVFDLGSGEFTATGGGESDDAGGTDRQMDPEHEAVIEDLAALPINELTPVEVLSRVQELKRRLQ
ncbi:MAG: MutS-related protein, partial [Halanaeroarchaeum sp.]